jgi:hypothetical protein
LYCHHRHGWLPAPLSFSPSYAAAAACPAPVILLAAGAGLAAADTAAVRPAAASGLATAAASAIAPLPHPPAGTGTPGVGRGGPGASASGGEGPLRLGQEQREPTTAAVVPLSVAATDGLLAADSDTLDPNPALALICVGLGTAGNVYSSAMLPPLPPPDVAEVGRHDHCSDRVRGRVEHEVDWGTTVTAFLRATVLPAGARHSLLPSSVAAAPPSDTNGSVGGTPLAPLLTGVSSLTTPPAVGACSPPLPSPPPWPRLRLHVRGPASLLAILFTSLLVPAPVADAALHAELVSLPTHSALLHVSATTLSTPTTVTPSFSGVGVATAAAEVALAAVLAEAQAACAHSLLVSAPPLVVPSFPTAIVASPAASVDGHTAGVEALSAPPVGTTTT